MSARLPLTLQINDQPVNTEAAFDDTLLTVLRDRLQLTAAKRGCNQGVCGACTVAIDGRPMRACLSLAHNCVGADVKTLEGLREEAILRALQDAFEQQRRFAVWFLHARTILVSAQALIAEQAQPSVEDVQRALSGNLCRCTGYKKITDAVLSAARTLRGEAMSGVPGEVGKRVAQLDTREKLNGEAQYIADLYRPNMLHGAILQSPHAHARIVGYDLSEALAIKGVRAIVTGDDVAR